jgi:hypothetical protein
LTIDLQFPVCIHAEAGLIFMDELNRVAKSLNILRGTLSRWLLPYDNNTAISDQISNVHSVVDSMPDSIRGKLTEKEVHYLVSGLNSVRQLVRVKIADDNDLEQVGGFPLLDDNASVFRIWLIFVCCWEITGKVCPAYCRGLLETATKRG